MSDDGERLAIAAAANVTFWGAVAQELVGRSWPGVAASVAAMTSVARGIRSPALDLVNLPGNVAAQVLQQKRVASRACACEPKDKSDATQ